MANDIRDSLVIKEQNHFTLFNPDGNIPIANTAGLGMYLGDTRHLSGYEVSLGRVQAVPLVSTARQGYASQQEQTNRDIQLGGRTIHKETLLISRERLAHDAGFAERITIANFNRWPVKGALDVRFAADFADIFAVRGVGQARRGDAERRAGREIRFHRTRRRCGRSWAPSLNRPVVTAMTGTAQPS